MALNTYASMIDAFIAANNLDEEIKDSLVDLVNTCIGGYVKNMSKEWMNTAVSSKSDSAVKATKLEKLEDPSEAKSLADLNACTSVILNAFCKENGLKVGGVKKDIKERVWRFLEGNSSEEDISPRSKPKKVVKKESHKCFACNSKGQPCGVSATEEFSGHWFCFRHIINAEDLLVKESKESEEWEESEEEEEPKIVSKKPTLGKKK